MNVLLRLLERRSIILIALLLAAVVAAKRWGAMAHESADMMLRPPADAVSPLAADILKEAEARESAKLKGLHRAVSAEIAAAAEKGFEVEAYQRLADGALALNTRAGRSEAIERLNRVRLTIPRKMESFRPAVSGDLNPDRLEDTLPKGKATKRKASKR